MPNRLQAILGGFVAVGVALTAFPAGPANAQGAADSAACVDEWNSGSNSDAQQNLLALFPEGSSGWVVVGTQAGDCVLAARNSAQPNYVVYRQSGTAFARTLGEGSGDEYAQYKATVNGLDVVLQPTGQVEPA